MKKRTSKILSILLAFALIVSAGDVVRAEDVDEQRTQTQEMAEPQEPEAETEEFKDINVVFAILMLTIAIILTMLFAAQIVETNRRKKRRRRLQAMKEEGWSRNQLR